MSIRLWMKRGESRVNVESNEKVDIDFDDLGVMGPPDDSMNPWRSTVSGEDRTPGEPDEEVVAPASWR